MHEFLPKTILLGGPRHGDLWVVDNAAPPLLSFAVPGGGYLRHVAQRTSATAERTQARVFYRHEDLDGTRLEEALRIHWQQGAAVAYGHDARHVIGIPGASLSVPAVRVVRPAAVEELIRHRHWSAIRAWRVYRNLTQAEVALRVGLDPSAYSHVENQRTRAGDTLLSRLAGVLDAPPDQLID